jgi:hypothetical protein
MQPNICQYPLMNYPNLAISVDTNIFCSMLYRRSQKLPNKASFSIPMGYKKLVSHEVRLFFRFPTGFGAFLILQWLQSFIKRLRGSF